MKINALTQMRHLLMFVIMASAAMGFYLTLVTIGHHSSLTNTLLFIIVQTEIFAIGGLMLVSLAMMVLNRISKWQAKQQEEEKEANAKTTVRIDRLKEQYPELAEVVEIIREDFQIKEQVTGSNSIYQSIIISCVFFILGFITPIILSVLGWFFLLSNWLPR